MGSAEYVLGIDVGSSSAKVGLFTIDGRAVSTAARAYSTDEPRPGWKEQEAEVWWNGVSDAIREIGSGADLGKIVGIGCTGYICSHTLVDRKGKPLRPSLGFQDQRAVAETEQLYSLISREQLALELGIDLPPAATWPLPRLLWYLNNEPAILEKTRGLLHAKDFVNFRLTGEMATDASSNRGLINLETEREPGRVLGTLGLPHGLLPNVSRPEEVIGRVSRTASEMTGLPAGILVVTGWNDLNASVLGGGGKAEGDAFDVTGSSEHLGVITRSKENLPELMCGPYLPGKKLFYGMTLNGGGSLAWCSNTFEIEMAAVEQLAAKAPPGADSLFFLPYLDGERAPIWDSRAAGAFIGLRSYHTRAHLARAVLEGVAFGLRQILELVEREAGRVSRPIVISGGAARNRLWNEIKRNVWERPVAVPEHVHTGALGAAMLAAVATGAYANCEEAAGKMARIRETLTARPQWSREYRRGYIHFCRLYPGLREHFASVADEATESTEPECLTKRR